MTDKPTGLSPEYLESMRAYVDEGGQLSHQNGLELLAEMEQQHSLVIRNELDRTRAERDSWKAQFESASAAASEYSEFWEKHAGEFDQFGNYIPYSQIDGDLRAAKAEIERLRLQIADSTR